MKIAKVFASGRSQAVRIPKEFRFEGGEVRVARMGPAVVLMHPGAEWEFLREACRHFSPDFLRERAQPPRQERDFGE